LVPPPCCRHRVAREIELLWTNMRSETGFRGLSACRFRIRAPFPAVRDMKFSISCLALVLLGVILQRCLPLAAFAPRCRATAQRRAAVSHHDIAVRPRSAPRRCTTPRHRAAPRHSAAALSHAAALVPHRGAVPRPGTRDRRLKSPGVDKPPPVGPRGGRGVLPALSRDRWRASRAIFSVRINAYGAFHGFGRLLGSGASKSGWGRGSGRTGVNKLRSKSGGNSRGEGGP
jgi:hypothetical protein